MPDITNNKKLAQDAETDKIAIIAAACAGAIWVYDQIKISDGVSLAMILCSIFIVSGLLYLAMVGLTLSMKNKDAIRFLLGIKMQRLLFSFTIKYFWYISLYIIYQLAMSAFNIGFATANIILTVLTFIYGILAILFLFPRPQALLDKVLKRFQSKLDAE